MLRLLLLPLLAAASLLTGCSAGLRFAYNHLDTLVAAELDDYVTLDASQQRAFDVAFSSLWRWHRQTQLPRYAKDLRAMAASFAAGAPTPEQAEHMLALIDAHSDVTGDRILALLQPLLPQLQDRQVEHLIGKLKADIEREERKHANETLAERRQRFLDRASDTMGRWFGALNAEQRQALERQWERDLPTMLTAAERRQSKLDEVQALADVLANRHEADFPARLAALWHAEPTGRDAEAERSGQRITIELIGLVDVRQRERAQRKLLALAEDCEILSAAASEVPPAP